jgi:hypothetical protein
VVEARRSRPGRRGGCGFIVGAVEHAFLCRRIDQWLAEGFVKGKASPPMHTKQSRSRIYPERGGWLVRSCWRLGAA